MSAVVVVATRPVPATVARTVADLRAAGHRVDLLAAPTVTADVTGAADTTVTIRRPWAPRTGPPDAPVHPVPAARTRGEPAGRTSSGRPVRVLRRIARLPRAAVTTATNRTVGAGAMWAWAVRRSARARSLLAAADVLVAADVDAVYAVWLAARHNPRAAAVYGIGPALDLLDQGE